MGNDTTKQSNRRLGEPENRTADTSQLKLNFAKIWEA